MLWLVELVEILVDCETLVLCVKLVDWLVLDVESEVDCEILVDCVKLVD